MAEKFSDEGVLPAAVHGSSPLSRGEALERLANGQLQIIFQDEYLTPKFPEVSKALIHHRYESGQCRARVN